MARRIIKRFIPDPDWIRQQKSLKFLESWLHDPNLWHLNRHSVSTATFIGCFVAFIPLPAQMIIAAAMAIMVRGNLPISVALVWITNPFTMAPIYYVAYKVGTAVMDTEASQFSFELSWEWLRHGLENTWQPFLLGCMLCGLFFSLLASTLVRLAWRQYAISCWKERCSKRKAKR